MKNITWFEEESHSITKLPSDATAQRDDNFVTSYEGIGVPTEQMKRKGQKG